MIVDGDQEDEMIEERLKNRERFEEVDENPMEDFNVPTQSPSTRLTKKTTMEIWLTQFQSEQSQLELEHLCTAFPDFALWRLNTFQTRIFFQE